MDVDVIQRDLIGIEENSARSSTINAIEFKNRIDKKINKTSKFFGDRKKGGGFIKRCDRMKPGRGGEDLQGVKGNFLYFEIRINWLMIMILPLKILQGV